MQIDALYSASRLLTAAPNIGDIGRALLELVVQMSQAQSGALAFFDEPGLDEPEAGRAAAPAIGPDGGALRTELLSHGAAGACLTCPEAARCPLPDGVRCLPIVAGRHVLGLLRLKGPMWDGATRQSLNTLLGEIAAVWMARQAESRALSALGRAGRGLGSEEDIDDVLRRFTELICEAFGATGATLFHLEADEPRPMASSTGAWSRHVPEALPAGADAVWSERNGRRVYAMADRSTVIAMSFAAVRPLTQRDTDLLRSLASQTGVLSNIAPMLPRMLWRERRRMGRELHDGLSQILGYLHMQMRRLAARPPGADAEGQRDDLRALSAAALDAYDELRATIDDLQLSPRKGEAALAFLQRIADAFAHREKIEVFVDAGDQIIVSETVLAHMARTVQETLSNAVRHGKVNRIDITLDVAVDNAVVHVVIRDNGAGFDARRMDIDPGHYGLLMLRERAESVGGGVGIESRPGAGATIHAWFPSMGVAVASAGGGTAAPKTPVSG